MTDNQPMDDDDYNAASYAQTQVGKPPFDYPTWAAQGRANADKLPSAVAEALGPERDWADEYAADYYDGLMPLAKFLRTLCRPIGNDTVTDELVNAEIARLEEQVRIYRGAQLRAEEKLSREQDNAKGWKLRAERLEEALAKAEATQ